MRFTTRFSTIALATTLTACVGEPPRPARTTDAGTTTEAKCDSMDTVTKDLLVTSGTISDTIPSGCWELEGKLTVRGANVTSLSMLGDLRGATNIELDGTNLTALDLKSAVDIAGTIRITNNAKLTGLDNIHGVETVQLVDVESNGALTSLGGAFDDVVNVLATITIRSNPKLTAVELPKLANAGSANAQIGQATLITGNPVLTRISLPAFMYPNRLEISDNPLLSSIDDLPARQIVSDFVIRNNPALSSLPSFSALEKVGGSITISNNQTLTSVGQFPQLTNVYGGLTIDSNPALTGVAGLTGSIPVQIATLAVTNNTQLTDLGQLSHEVYGSITITGNTALSSCKAREVDVCAKHTATSTITGNHQQNNCTSWCNR